MNRWRTDGDDGDVDKEWRQSGGICIKPKKNCSNATLLLLRNEECLAYFSQKQLCKNTIQSIWQTVRTRAQGKFTGVRGAGAAMGNKCLVDVV